MKPVSNRQNREYFDELDVIDAMPFEDSGRCGFFDAKTLQ
jgi:hypothetical protein